MSKKNESIGEYVDISTLQPWDLNPRNNDDTINRVAISIKRFGFSSPIIARKEDSMIIAGHTRYQASIKLGLTKVPVRFMDLSPTDAQLLAIADNKIQELSKWKDDELRNLIKDLSDEDIFQIGFSDEEFEDLVNPQEPYEFVSDIDLDDDEIDSRLSQVILWYDKDELDIFNSHIELLLKDSELSPSQFILQILKKQIEEN